MTRSVLVEYNILSDASMYAERILDELANEKPDRQKMLWYASKSGAYHKHMLLPIRGNEEYDIILYYKGFHYYCLEMGYLWSNWFEEAFQAEQYFITNELLGELEAGIYVYLSVLIIKKQTAHLQELFNDIPFKEKFIAYYEEFISLLVNPDYRVTQSLMILTPIINRIRSTEILHRQSKIL